MIRRIRSKVEAIRRKKQWRKRNQGNNTVMGSSFNIDLVSVGKKTYGVLNVINHSEKYRLTIGSYCSIAPDVTFVVCGEHPIHHISTFPFKTHCCGEKFEAISKGDIIVEDDVWIGTKAIVMSGVTIHRGAVIAAGTIVTHDVPAYGIVAGIPARLIKKRFSDEQIQLLMNINYERLDQAIIEKHIDLLYEDIDSDRSCNAIKQFIDVVNGN